MSPTFTSLPFELRTKIWTFCIPSPRILIFKLDRSWKPDLYSQNPQPVLLFINHESREFLLDSISGGYSMLRIIDRGVAFHPARDSVCFIDGTELRRKFLDLSTPDSETTRNKKLAIQEKMLTYWLEEPEHGNRLRDWLVEHDEVLALIPMQQETVNGRGSNLAIAEITQLKYRLDDREDAPWAAMASIALDTDPFCRDLVRNG